MKVCFLLIITKHEHWLAHLWLVVFNLVLNKNILTSPLQKIKIEMSYEEQNGKPLKKIIELS